MSFLKNEFMGGEGMPEHSGEFPPADGISPPAVKRITRSVEHPEYSDYRDGRIERIRRSRGLLGIGRSAVALVEEQRRLEEADRQRSLRELELQKRWYRNWG